MNRISLPRRAVALLLAAACVLAASVSLASPAADEKDRPRDGDSADLATLVISTQFDPGHFTTTMELRLGDTLVRATVHNYHNVPTKYRSIRGSFYPIYLVLFSKTHRTPEALQSAESILTALKQEGVTVVEDKLKARPDDGGPRVRTLKLRPAEKKLEAAKVPPAGK